MKNTYIKYKFKKYKLNGSNLNVTIHLHGLFQSVSYSEQSTIN